MKNMLKKFFKEFKEFISKGNVMDMAIGIIIGGAFTSIVSSLVEDIINPFLGLFGGMNFDQYSVTLLGDATLNYGKFITAVINFLIMALVIFLIVKLMNGASAKLTVKKEEEEAEDRCSLFLFPGRGAGRYVLSFCPRGDRKEAGGGRV